MTNKAGEQSPAYFLPYLNPLLNPFPVFTGLGEKVKTRYPLRDNGFQWSCWADSNRRPHPYQGCALPTELQQRMATRKGLEPSTSGVTGRRSNQLNYRAILVSIFTASAGYLFGRGRRIRTLGTRFWRPMLYQLSYTPKWWAFTGSNRGPAGYEPAALTN